ncbi:Tex family protein [Thalassotalea sp. PP2-459]|uniref:Tex family protein n=1 Tax=Thalassotalea sp. PP2-459 TaxID=1742724 RepID=UPI0009433048|nr:Tex family protein [Thalassotalea sp. PP2-459]OKY26614.1 RNA-binding transcriptional accessory protein [Thalassotalea sp. PP2-459]
MSAIAAKIAQELNVKTDQVTAAISLLDDGSTVPFIARYRKEATKGLDDGHLRTLSQRLEYLRELEERRHVILTNIEQQDKLTPPLRQAILDADNKTRLEDLYLPYRPKRRTKGQIAIEAGLEPLASALFQQWQLVPEIEAEQYINIPAGFENTDKVLEGAIYILIERFAEDAALLAKLRRLIAKQAHLKSKVLKKKEKEGAKYRDYFEYSEKIVKIPSHRALALLRGRNEGFLSLSLDVDPQQESSHYSSAEHIITEHYQLNLSSQPAAKFLTKVVHMAWKVKFSQSLETEFLGTLREKAEQEAILVFAKNLKDLLMAAPAGPKVTMGIDPGFRTGCKIAVVDATGKLLKTATIFPHEPQNNWDKSIRTLVNLARQYKVDLIAIGNGTASRESDKLAGEVVKACDGKIKKIIVSEAGASVYSASELAATEFPDIDVSIRGAVSIARRLQDPLAELVKIDPKAIGVGQYQHDVSQSKLSKALDNVIEDCVNAVGVDINSASAALLTRVAGLNKTIANNVIRYRDTHGRFNSRKDIKSVERLGPKAFEQAAGFLRISDGINPLDASGVHPETYPIVDKIVAQLNTSIDQVLNEEALANKVDFQSLVDDKFGDITVKDVVQELAKPARDPRPEFKTATFTEGVESIKDLNVGMVLEGVVSNVANFGAFVDLGVHQDGLVHISAITNKFISDPRDVVKAGDIVKVKVTEVDVERKRISLTMRLTDEASAPTKQKYQPTHTPKSNTKSKHQAKQQHHNKKPKPVENAAMGNAFADAFAKLKK